MTINQLTKNGFTVKLERNKYLNTYLISKGNLHYRVIHIKNKNISEIIKLFT